MLRKRLLKDCIEELKIGPRDGITLVDELVFVEIEDKELDDLGHAHLYGVQLNPCKNRCLQIKALVDRCKCFQQCLHRLTQLGNVHCTDERGESSQQVGQDGVVLQHRVLRPVQVHALTILLSSHHIVHWKESLGIELLID